MNARAKKPWMIQVRLPADKGCSIDTLKKMLKGTGVEVDTTYVPKRVAPAIFVGRGFATARAVSIAQDGEWVDIPGGGRRSKRPGWRHVVFFEELRLECPLPELPPAAIRQSSRSSSRKQLNQLDRNLVGPSP